MLFLRPEKAPAGMSLLRNVIFLRFSEVFKVLALFYLKKCSFWVGKNRRRPPRTEEQGLGPGPAWARAWLGPGPGLGPGGIAKKGQQKLNLKKIKNRGDSPRCTDACVSSSGYERFKFGTKLIGGNSKIVEKRLKSVKNTLNHPSLLSAEAGIMVEI